MGLWLLFLTIGFTGLAVSVIALVWAVRSGQWDDLETPAVRALDDDDEPSPAPATHRSPP
jgi:cbb3-type cytochrome oxidase maturation protein